MESIINEFVKKMNEKVLVNATQDMNINASSSTTAQQRKIINRRKFRKKAESDNVLAAQIEAVSKKQSKGTVIHKRNSDGSKRIKLSSFQLNPGETYVAVTKSKFTSPLSSLAEAHRPPSISSFGIKRKVSRNFMTKLNSTTTKPHAKLSIEKKKGVGSKNSCDVAGASNGNPSSPVGKTIGGNKKSKGVVNNLQSGMLNSSSHTGKRKQKSVKTEKQPSFEAYMQKKDVLKGLQDGSLVKGILRINQKYASEAYVGQDDRKLQDYFIESVAERNKALEGDIVALKVYPENEAREGQMKAKVVYILERVHPRVGVGYLNAGNDKKNPKRVNFIPRDKRLPRMNILTNLPPNYYKSPAKYENVLFQAQITKWDSPKYASGTIIDVIGKADDIANESKSILLEFQIDAQPFPAEFNEYLPKCINIPYNEFSYREDYRSACVFTIDPLTAKDLDDAVSCRVLPNGNFEVGVHIADVAHYLVENTPLDLRVAKRATSTYLVDRVYHMLPQELCMFCSLLPDKDNLTFSVIWEINKNAEVVSTRFARTIINSCAQLAYEHAQNIIDSPNDDSCLADLPTIYNGFSQAVVKQIILNLHKLAVILRNNRMKNGTLRLDKVKISFNLDQQGEPMSYHIQEIKQANNLIEEFMLLANISVARKIQKHFPNLSLLRSHDSPNEKLLVDNCNMLENIGVHINTETSKDLATSLKKYKSDDYAGFARIIALNHLFAKPMLRAKYFCSANHSENSFYHFALATPIYTHFTSPIRRYADVMVHRILSATLGYTSKPSLTPEKLQEISDVCNKQKYNAQRAGEMSSDLYLARYIDKNQPFITDAVVVFVQEKSFDAVTIHTGTTIRIYANSLPEGVQCTSETFGQQNKNWRMNIYFPSSDKTEMVTLQVIDLFEVVQVSLKRKEKKSYKLEATIVRPKPKNGLQPI